MKRLKSILRNLLHPAGIAGTVIALAIPFLIYLAPNIGAKEILRVLDQKLPFWLFLGQFALGLCLFLSLSKDFRAYLKEHFPQKGYTILVAVFALFMTVFAGTQIEARHRVQSDESVFMAIAQNMYFNRTTGTCDEGEFRDGHLDCHRNSDSFKTKGLSFLYLLGMPFFGPDLHWVFHAELLMLFFAALLLFLAIRAWTADDMLAALSSIILFAQPTVLFQFRSMSVEPLYIFLSALALWVFKWAFDRNTCRHWIFAAIVLAFFAQTRQETVFCLAAFLAIALPKILDRKDFKAPAFFFSLSVFSIPVLLTISFFQGYGFQGGAFSAHGHFIENLLGNWSVMTKPLTASGLLENPFLASFNYLFLAGLLLLIVFAAREIKDKTFGPHLKIAGFLLLYHIQTYVILENVSGDFTIEINQRYALVMMPTMAFFAAFALKNLVRVAYFLLGISNLKTNVFLGLFVTVLLALGISGNTLRFRESFNQNIMYRRNHLTTEEAEIWKWLKAQPEKPRLFVYGRPWHFIAYGKSAIHYDRMRKISPDSLERLIQKYDGEVYYIRGLDCWDSRTYHAKAVEHRIPTTCDVFEREAKLEDVYRVLITNNYRVRIARIHAKRNYDPAKLFAFGFWQGTPEEETLIFNSAEYRQTSEPWKVRISLNGNEVFERPYAAGSHSDTVRGAVLTPGYNRLAATIYDSTSNEKIAEVEDYRFFRFEGALQLNLMQPVRNRQGWGELHTNSTIEGNAFTLFSRTFKEGFGTHAPSATVFDIRGEFSRFTAMIGLDEESLCSDGIAYRVFGDNRLLFQKAALPVGKIDTIDVSVQGVRYLEIQTDSLKSKDCDHVDIVFPTLYPDPNLNKTAKN